MSFVRKFYRESCAGVLLTVGALWSVSLSAASGLPAGTFVLDVANKTQSFGDLEETVSEVRRNRCQLDQSSLTIMTYDGGADDVSRGEQRQALGIKSQGQDCAFAGADQAWTFVPGSVIPSAAEIRGWQIDFIVTDDAVFEIALLDDSGTALQLLDGSGAPIFYDDDGDAVTPDVSVNAFKIYTGKAACSPEGTSGVPRSLEDWEQNLFPCVAQSNPNSDFDGQTGLRPSTSLDSFGDVSLPDGIRQIKISVISGSSGVTAAEFDFELVPTGTLTCIAGDGDTVTDPLAGSFDPGAGNIFEVGNGMQCRRLPNRGSVPCEPVPYVVEASCDGEDCEVEFLHGDQPDVDRADFAFVCEVWWPSRTGNFTSSGVPVEPIVSRTEVLWGGLTSPLVRAFDPSSGDPLDLNWCPGITPVFSGSTCGTDVEYKLSEPASVGLEDGGTVSPTDGSCSLLEAYDDFLVVAPGAAGSPLDQCDETENSDCPTGRQLACLGHERYVLEEDAALTDGAVDPDQTGPGRINTPANSKYRKYELILIEGDIRLRGIR